MITKPKTSDVKGAKVIGNWGNERVPVFDVLSTVRIDYHLPLRCCVLLYVDFVVVKYFVRLYDSGAAFDMLFHVKGVFRVCVGQVLVFRVLRDVVFIREERAHTSKLQDTFPAVHDRDFVLRHKLFA